MDFLKIFHIDCGRKYFTPEELKRIIVRLGQNGFNTIELAFGNGGMRFLLNDMEIVTSVGRYGSSEVRTAINSGNRAFCDCGTNELTEEEMEELIYEAERKGIQIMPLLNTPGHMDAIVTAMKELHMAEVGYRGSVSTFDLACTEAAEFTKALLQKYVGWFADHGCTYFNMGCDEYANDVMNSGFEALCSGDDFKYDMFVAYVNDVAGGIFKKGMRPVMFNDGMYYDGTETGGELRRDIICAYWSTGWEGYRLAPARCIEQHGHKIINTSNSWYYVLGRRKDEGNNPIFNNEMALEGIKRTGIGEIPGGADNEPIGAMLCLWCDEPGIVYTEEEEKIVAGLIEEFGRNSGQCFE